MLWSAAVESSRFGATGFCGVHFRWRVTMTSSVDDGLRDAIHERTTDFLVSAEIAFHALANTLRSTIVIERIGGTIPIGGVGCFILRCTSTMENLALHLRAGPRLVLVSPSWCREQFQSFKLFRKQWKITVSHISDFSVGVSPHSECEHQGSRGRCFLLDRQFLVPGDIGTL